jgi:hypothetical protein
MKQVYAYGEILAHLQCVAPGAQIAGGAVRDTLLERPIRDVDVFLHDNHADAAATALRFEFGYVKVGEWKQYEGFSDPAVTRVAKFEKANETIPLCLIALSRGAVDEIGRDNIRRFDFGICMAAWTGQDLIIDDRFNADRDRQTFTLHRADNEAQFAYSMARFKKLTQERYAGWQLSVPSYFEDLVKEHAFNSKWYRCHDSRYDYQSRGIHFGHSQETLRPKS